MCPLRTHKVSGKQVGGCCETQGRIAHQREEGAGEECER